MLLDSWVKEKYPELSDLKIKFNDEDDYIDIPLFMRLIIAALLNDSSSDCVFIVPNPKAVSKLTSLLSSLIHTKENFQEYLEDFARNALKKGQRVRLIPNDNIYEYGGYMSAHGESFIRLNLLGNKGGCASLPLSDALRLFPTKKKRPIGKGKTDGISPLSPLDVFLDISSYGNYSLFQNRILLQDSYKDIDDFFYEWSLVRQEVTGSFYLNDLGNFPWGRLTTDGTLVSFNQYQDYGEPIIGFSDRLSNIHQYCENRSIDSRTIISSNKRSVIQNAYETHDLCDKQKMFLFTDSVNSLEVEHLKNMGFDIWKIDRDIISHNFNELDGYAPFKASMNFQGDHLLNVNNCTSNNKKYVYVLIKELYQSVGHDKSREEILDRLKRLLWRSYEITSTANKCYMDWFFKQKDKIIEASSRQLPFIGIENYEKIKLTIKLIEGIWSQAECNEPNDKLDKINKLIKKSYNKKIAVLFRNSNARDCFELKKNISENVVLMTYDELASSHQVFDLIILVSWPGPEIYRKFISNTSVSHIEALFYDVEEMALDSYIINEENLTKDISLSAKVKSKILGCPESLFEEKSDCEKEYEGNKHSVKTKSPLDISWVERPSFENDIADSTAKTESFYVSFNDDRYCYMTESYKISTIDPQSMKYSLKTAKDLNLGDIVIFRKDNNREIIKEIAEKLYPDTYQQLVGEATIWKKWLRQLGDIKKAHKSLSLHGIRRDLVTVKNWMESDEIIAPRSIQDIITIYKVVHGQEASEQRPNDVADAARKLRSIHIEVGFKLAKTFTLQVSKELTETSFNLNDLEVSDIELATVDNIEHEMLYIPNHLVNKLNVLN